MKLGIGKKLIGAHGIGLALFFIIAIFSYISLNSYSYIQKRTDELVRRMESISDLQILINKLLMPPNDYLITGDIKERESFAHLVTETSSALANIKVRGGKTDEELGFEKEVEKGFIELQQKAMVPLSAENPVGNKEAARLMEEMDAFADGLTNIAGVLKNTVRKSDTVARYGGEKFMIVLPETDGEMALITAEKLRKAVEESKFNNRKITISLGLASYTESLMSADDLIKNADNALYRAKKEGRNRVCS